MQLHFRFLQNGGGSLLVQHRSFSKVLQRCSKVLHRVAHGLRVQFVGEIKHPSTMLPLDILFYVRRAHLSAFIFFANTDNVNV